jgi:hypothetical protein
LNANSNTDNNSNYNSKISFSKKISRENKNFNFFGKKEIINIEEELSKSEDIENKRFQKDKEININENNNNRSCFKNNNLASDDNSNKFNLVNKESNDKFIDKKIKTLFSKKFDNTFQNHKTKSFLTLMNFSIGVNYFLYKSNDFKLANEYLNVINPKK